MTIVAAQRRDSYFAMVPEKYVFSDHISDRGLHILAFLDASKSNHKGFVKGDPMRWPVFSTKELAEKLGMSERTLKREIARLQKSGHVKTTKTVKGNRYELIKVEFEDDTYRDRQVSSQKSAHVTLTLIVSGISSGALRLWMVLDRIKGKNPSAYASHAGLAKIMGVSDRTVRTWLKELREIGAVVSELREPGGMCKYFLIGEPSPEVKEQPEPEVVEDEAEEIDPEVKEATGRVSWKWINAVVEDDPDGWVEENEEEFSDIWWELYDAISEHGESVVRAGVEKVIETYGTDYPADFILKVLDEVLNADEESEEPVNESDAEPEYDGWSVGGLSLFCAEAMELSPGESRDDVNEKVEQLFEEAASSAGMEEVGRAVEFLVDVRRSAGEKITFEDLRARVSGLPKRPASNGSDTNLRENGADRLAYYQSLGSK